MLDEIFWVIPAGVLGSIPEEVSKDGQAESSKKLPEKILESIPGEIPRNP